MRHTFVIIEFKPFFTASPQKTHETIENKGAIAAAIARTRIAPAKTPPSFQNANKLMVLSVITTGLD
jgi:hypothetical protein